jgi:hypothetical protein
MPVGGGAGLGWRWGWGRVGADAAGVGAAGRAPRGRAPPEAPPQPSCARTTPPPPTPPPTTHAPPPHPPPPTPHPPPPTPHPHRSPPSQQKMIVRRMLIARSLPQPRSMRTWGRGGGGGGVGQRRQGRGLGQGRAAARCCQPAWEARRRHAPPRPAAPGPHPERREQHRQDQRAHVLRRVRHGCRCRAARGPLLARRPAQSPAVGGGGAVRRASAARAGGGWRARRSRRRPGAGDGCSGACTRVCGRQGLACLRGTRARNPLSLFFCRRLWRARVETGAAVVVPSTRRGGRYGALPAAAAGAAREAARAAAAPAGLAGEGRPKGRTRQGAPPGTRAEPVRPHRRRHRARAARPPTLRDARVRWGGGWVRGWRPPWRPERGTTCLWAELGGRGVGAGGEGGGGTAGAGGARHARAGLTCAVPHVRQPMAARGPCGAARGWLTGSYAYGADP